MKKIRKKHEKNTNPMDQQVVYEENVSDVELIRFVARVMSLKPLELNGLLRIMCIAPSREKHTKSPEEIISEVIDGYIELGKKQRKELNELLIQVKTGK